MKSVQEIKEILQKHKKEIKEKYKVKKMGIFGSYVKGEQQENSDLDILVEFENSIGLLKFIELENYLSEIIGIKVDLVMKDALKPRIGKHILEEVINI